MGVPPVSGGGYIPPSGDNPRLTPDQEKVKELAHEINLYSQSLPQDLGKLESAIKDLESIEKDPKSGLTSKQKAGIEKVVKDYNDIVFNYMDPQHYINNLTNDAANLYKEFG